MMMQTKAGVPVSAKALSHYFETLVAMFFKILPIWEERGGEGSLNTYMKSLQIELLGCEGLVTDLQSDASLLSLAAILQFLIDTPSCEVATVKREVFRAISICNKLRRRYSFAEEVAE